MKQHPVISHLQKHADASTAQNKYGLTADEFAEATKQLKTAGVPAEEWDRGYQLLGNMDADTRKQALAEVVQLQAA